MTLTVLSLSLLAGCSVLQGFLGDGGAEAVAQADQLLVDGDIAGSMAAYAQALSENPESVDAAIGVAYGAWLEGDFGRVDSTLAAAEPFSEGRLPELQLRRSMALLAQGSTDEAKAMAIQSGTPAGAVLAAEVWLADADPDEAIALLQSARSAGGDVGETADSYLELLQAEDPSLQGLAENYALWAIGERSVAVRTVEDVVMGLSDDDDRKAEELLLWAGRSASQSEFLVASNLLEAITFPPAGQAWRVRATRTILNCAEGAEDDYAACRQGFAELEGLAPADGLVHARATAAMLIEDTQVVVEILGETPSTASAMAAAKAGDPATAKRLAPAGLYADYLAQR